MHFFPIKFWISIEISLKFDPTVDINNIQALVQIIAWRGSRQQTIILTNGGYIVDAYMYMRHSAPIN